MNGISRVQSAIYRLPLDRVPKGELLVEKGFIDEFLEMTGENEKLKCQDAEIEFYHRIGLDLVCIHYERPQGLHRKNIKSYDNIKRYINEGFFVFALLDGAFQTSMRELGFTDFLKMTAARPDEAVKEIRFFSQKLIPLIQQAAQEGAHGIIIADDIAYNRGPYMSPAIIKEFILPCWQEQVNAAGELNMPVFFHSDGNITDVLPAIVEAGFNGLQCIEPASGMDIKEVKDKYGHRLCLMGNIDPALLSRGSGMDTQPGSENQNHPSGCGSFKVLEKAVRNLVSAAAPGGGFIFGSCSGLHAGLSPEKVRFMYEMAEKMGTYR
ncbi:MAG: uroporphyrinogen decarboxylase family protein [Bacillota bacterium]